MAVTWPTGCLGPPTASNASCRITERFITSPCMARRKKLWFHNGDSKGHPVEKPRDVPKIFTALVRRQIQNADAGDSRPERLSARRERRISTVHDAAAIGDSVQDVVFSRRRPLGP